MIRFRNSFLSWLNSFEAPLKLGQGQRHPPLIFVDPTLADLIQRNGVKIMQFRPPVPEGNYKVGRLQ